MSNSNPNISSDDAQSESLVSLVSGAVADTGDLFAAHADAIKREISERAADIRDTVLSGAIASVVLAIAGVSVAAAIVLTLAHFGVPAWIACWSVAVAVSITGLVLLRRATHAGKSDGDPTAAASKAINDTAWVAKAAGDTVA